MSKKYFSRGRITESARLAASKNVATFIKQELVDELNLGRLKDQKEKWSLNHCANLVQERQDQERVQELVDLFRISIPEKNTGIQKFYYWYKDYQISNSDSMVYQVFDSVAEEMKLAQSDPCKFSGLGDLLIERLEEWKGSASNTTQDLIIDYFSSILTKAIKFNATLATSPKSLLSRFGWNLWVEHVDKKYGGKLQYLDASLQDLEQSKHDNLKLKEIQYIKNRALQKSDISLYDEIGRLLTTEGIKKTYEKLHVSRKISSIKPEDTQRVRVRVGST